MIAVIRIKGRVDIPKKIKDTLKKLRIRKKYSCSIIRENSNKVGMVKKVRDYVTYGKIDKETFIKLLEERGKSLNKKKLDAKKIVEDFVKSKTDKRLSDFGVKNFFRLHPPRGGINTKKHYPKGVLGENKEINKLIERML
jgi:large subunit ribosomal protein L30